MFKFLFKERPTDAVLLDLDSENTRVIFQCAQELKQGTQLKVNFLSGNGRSSVPAAVEVKSIRTSPLGGFTCVAQLLQGDMRALRELKPEVPLEGMRRYPRFPCSLRVFSQQLPGYQALAKDLSEGGMKLDLSGPLEPGTDLELKIETNRADWPWLDVIARVMWCRQKSRGGYEAGLAFLPMHPNTVEFIRWMVSSLQSSQQADIYHRIMGVDDI